MKNIFPVLAFFVLVFSAFPVNGGEFVSRYCGPEALGSPAYYPSYTLTPNYVISGSDYVFCPGSTMHIGDLGSYIAVCGDGRENVLTHNLVAWVYQGSTKLQTTCNDYCPVQSVQRSEVIGPGSNNLCLYVYGGTRRNYMDVYTFNNPGDYSVYLDYMKSICGTSERIHYVAACPWLGGTRKNTMCHNWEGWVPQKTFSIKVPGPAVSITPPASPISGAPGSSYQLAWVIRNTGIGNAVYSASTICPGYACSFVGYTAGSGIVLSPGASYNLVMKLNVLDSSPAGNVGLRVTYDEAYGLTCVAPASRDSMVWVNGPLDDAQYISQSVPNPMCAGWSYTASVTMKNSGTSTWTAAKNYRLGSQNPQDNGIWGGRIYLSASDSIGPGASKTFSFTVTAPSVPGTYNFQWRMVREYVAWFGANTPNVAVTVKDCSAITTLAPPTTLAQADLSVPNIRHAGSTIYYDLLNSGGAAAVASRSSLTIDGSFIREEYAAAIAGRSQRQESFNYAWSCSGSSDTVRVCADNGHVVPESDETNNCNTVTWNCGGGATTSTTLAAATTTTTTFAVPTTLRRVTVTLRYQVRDDKAESVNCSVWTNITDDGSWRINATQEVSRNEKKRVTLFRVPEGMWGWTVNCSDNANPSVWPINATRTVSAPGKYWIFYVEPAPTTSSTTSSLATTSTTTTRATTTSTTSLATTSTSTTSTTLPYIIPGNSDVVLLTDLSKTMMYCLDGGHSGCSITEDTCPNDPPHANGCTDVNGANPVRYDYARKLNKDFVDRVLGRSNNRVALVAFGEKAGTVAPFGIGLSGDATYLKNQINQYTPGSGTIGTGTGTCVAIRAARKILEEQSTPSRNKYIILLSDGVANYRCTGTYPTLTTYQAGQYCCSTNCGGLGDPGPGCGRYVLMGSASCRCSQVTGGYKIGCFSVFDTAAVEDSREDACAARTSLGSSLQIYSIGLFNPGFVTDCHWGKDNLDAVSACGGGQTFIGTSTSELESIFNKF